jgi:membrane-bound lytic murein transglycosylase B
MRGKSLTVAFVAGLISTTSAYAQSCQNNPALFPAWLDAFRVEALAAGVSGQTVAVLNAVRFDQTIVNRDRSQDVFSQSFLEFTDRVVSSYRLQTGTRLLSEYSSTLAQIE